jgi:hypothetical protein
MSNEKMGKLADAIEQTMVTMAYLIVACVPVYIIFSLGNSNPALVI